MFYAPASLVKSNVMQTNAYLPIIPKFTNLGSFYDFTNLACLAENKFCLWKCVACRSHIMYTLENLRKHIRGVLALSTFIQTSSWSRWNRQWPSDWKGDCDLQSMCCSSISAVPSQLCLEYEYIQQKVYAQVKLCKNACHAPPLFAGSLRISKLTGWQVWIVMEPLQN